MNLFHLDGKGAIVTGASRGIGRAAAVALAEAGARVAVLGNTATPEETSAEITALGATVLAFRGDMCDRAFREQVVADVLAAWGSIDILVNNAGTTVREPAVDFPEEAWDRVLEINLTSVFRMCQLVGRHMLQ